jgi:methylamine--corrinoid protein Co-methyltransferase
MIVFSDVVHRALNGPFAREKDFDQKLFMTKIADVVKKHDIRYDEKEPVPSDDDLADRVFQAALDLYTEVGTYCLDSHRIIRFSREEILEGLREHRKQGRFGEGADAKVFPVRRPESGILPWCSVGACGGGVSSEDVFRSLMRGYAQITLADSITTPSLISVDGVPIRSKTPLELEGSIRTVILSKEAVSQAGRPGIPIVNGVASASTDVATIAADHFGLARTDAWEVSSIAEMKVDFSMLNKVAYLHRVGGQQWNATAPIMGGYAGGPEGTAVATAAYNLQAIMVNQAEVQHPFNNHISYLTNTGREMLWVVSVSSQAITRNSPLPIAALCFAGAGPMTDMIFYEITAWTLAAVTSGASIEVAAIAKNTALDHTTPYEPQFGAEVAHRAVGMSRKEANRICLDLVGRYEKDLPNPPAGKRFQDCFDIQTSTPTQEYRNFYKTMKKKIHDLGVPLGG